MSSDAAALDAGQYTPDAIRQYEAVYGPGFVSPGGAATTLALLGRVAITPAMRVLDVGCGLGGAALLLAGRFGATVQGIDLSQNMLRVARARCAAAGLAGLVTFAHADVLRYDQPDAFDLIHSRDVFLHIHAKERLFAALVRCLRPGGTLLFTDYLRAEGPPSPEFAAYIARRGYDLRTLGEYRALIAQAGLELLAAEDRTAEFADILARELAYITAGAAPLAPHERAELARSWQAKLARAQAGEQRWGFMLACWPAL